MKTIKNENIFFLGVDIGSTTFKAVLLTPKGKVHHTVYTRTKPMPDAILSCSGECHKCGRCNLGAISKTIDDFLASAGIDRENVACTITTGSQIVDGLVDFIKYDAYVSEISAHVAGARHYYPDVKCILDVGGQDSKAILFDEDMQMWMSKMSGICAAGTGAFLDSVAAKLNVPVEDMDEKVNYDSKLQVSSICAVLSATSVNKFKNRYPLGDIIGAACRAQARTVMSGVGELFLDYKGPIVFQGGVASNNAVGYYLKEITNNEIIIPEFHQVMGALGAACLAAELYEKKKKKDASYEEKSVFKVGVDELQQIIESVGGTPLAKKLGGLKNKLFVHKSDNGLEKIGIPSIKQVKDAIGDVHLIREFTDIFDKVVLRKPATDKGYFKKSIAMRANITRRELFSRNRDVPMVWRNLFYPPEILNAFGARTVTLETYAAFRARNPKKLQQCFDRAASKGYSAETCSFLRVLEGDEKLPTPDFAVTTTEPCQQGERIFADLVRDYNLENKYYTLHTPYKLSEHSVEQLAGGLRESVKEMEKAFGYKLEHDKLAEACEFSNQAREYAMQANEIRFTSPPLIHGSDAILNALVFSPGWGKPEFVELQKTFRDELIERKKEVELYTNIEDTHRLVWLHLPPFYSKKLMNFIEVTNNAPIVYEEVNHVGWDILDVNDPYVSLAKRILTVGFLDPELRVKKIAASAAHAKFTGCVLYNHMFGRCSMADSSFIKHLKEELKKVKVPLLVLDGDCLDETTDPCSTYTKVSAFVESLNTKRFDSMFGK